MTVEARVFDTGTAKVTKVRDSDSNEMLNVLDRSTMTPPILRREYQVHMTVERSVFAKQTEEEIVEFARQEAREAIRQILTASLPDIGSAISTTASAP